MARGSAVREEAATFLIRTEFAVASEQAVSSRAACAASVHTAEQIISVATVQTADRPVAVAVALAVVSEAFRRPARAGQDLRARGSAVTSSRHHHHRGQGWRAASGTGRVCRSSRAGRMGPGVSVMSAHTAERIISIVIVETPDRPAAVAVALAVGARSATPSGRII